MKTIYTQFSGAIKAASVFVIALLFSMAPFILHAQTPVISYGSINHRYKPGTTVTTLTPTQSGVSAPGYNPTQVLLADIHDATGIEGPVGMVYDKSNGSLIIADYQGGVIRRLFPGSSTTTVVAT